MKPGSRTQILERIRRASQAAGPDDLERRIRQQGTGVRPRALGPTPLEELRIRLEANAARIRLCASAAALGNALAGLLGELGQQQPAPCGQDARLHALPRAAELLVWRTWQAGDRVCVSHADLGIAETGSLSLPATANNPGTLNFLPDHHIVLLQQADIVDNLDQAWQRQSAQDCPRALHLISGPSRTADIEQTIQLGAHGPRELHVLIY